MGVYQEGMLGRHRIATQQEIDARLEQEAKGEGPKLSQAEIKARQNFKPRVLTFGTNLTPQPTEVYPDQAEARDIFSEMVSKLASEGQPPAPEEQSVE